MKKVIALGMLLVPAAAVGLAPSVDATEAFCVVHEGSTEASPMFTEKKHERVYQVWCGGIF